MDNTASLQVDLRELARRSDEPMRLRLGDDFFAKMGGDEVLGVMGGNVDVALSANGPVGGIYEVRYNISGTVTVPCDRCLSPMSQPIAATGIWAAQMGGFEPADGDALVAGEDDGMLDLAWPVYEQAVLAVPMRHVHEEGLCDSGMEERLRGLMVDSATTPESTEPSTTWKGMEKLRTIIKE